MTSPFAFARPAGEREQNIAEIIWKAAHMPGPDDANIFFVGPYGRRVSFASQQRRALNTVWVMKKRGVFDNKEDLKVAVVGAGLAGTTAAVALRAERVNVTLYESYPSALTLQSGTFHRLIHPTVNFWPSVQIEPSTYLPFFDWSSNWAAEVIADITREWQNSFLKEIDNPFFDTTVRRIQYVRKQRSIKITSFGTHGDRTRIPSSKTHYFDAVIVTTGFGEEVRVSHSRVGKYWGEDTLEVERERAANRTFIVSGTGDGGLIDAMRLIHSKFDKGKLPLKLIATLIGRNIEAKLNKIEREAAGVSEKDRADFLKKRYFSVLNELPNEAKQVLADGFCNKGKLTIVGRRRWPFALDTAPIHKLMIAYALRFHHVKYMQGEVDDTKRKLAIRRPIEGTKIEYPKCDFYVARHGASPPLDQLVPGLDVELLRQNQREVSDWLDLVDHDGVQLNSIFPSYPDWNPASTDFASHRLGRAESYIRRMYNAGTKLDTIKVRDLRATYPTARVAPATFTDESWIPVYVIEEQKPGASLTNEYGLTDRNLFGIPLIRSTVRIALPYGVPRDEAHAESQRIVKSGAPVTTPSADASVGTIGALLTKSDTDKVFGITAAHIVRDQLPISPGTEFEPIGQIIASGAPSSAREKSNFDSRIALFEVEENQSVHSAIDWMHGNLRFIKPTDAIGRTVLKNGISSGITKGLVVSVSGKIKMRDWKTGKSVVYRNVIEVEPDASAQPHFAQPGDSGALVITECGGVVGVVIGGHDRRTVVAPLYWLAKKERLQFIGQTPIVYEDDDDHWENEIRKIWFKFLTAPQKWDRQLAESRILLAKYFTRLNERFGLAHMESVQDRLAIQLLSSVGIEQFAKRVGNLKIIYDAPGPVPSDIWLLRSLIERQQLIEIDANSSRMRLSHGLGEWYMFDKNAPVMQWDDPQRNGERHDLSSNGGHEALPSEKLVNACLGFNSFRE